MEHTLICIPIATPALAFAGKALAKAGISVTACPGPEVTHLLLPVPSFGANGLVNGGGDLNALLEQLPRDVTILGGNLDHPALERYRIFDLLRCPGYLWENAAITAHCALKYILDALPVTLPGQKILIIGWGRIGKCLALLLKALDAEVTVSARKDTDRAMVRALGFGAVDCADPRFSLDPYRVVVNTVPAPVLNGDACAPNCYKLDLASRLGISGENVVWARGLPGKDTPESSGRLIAKTILQLLYNKEADL